MFDWGGTYSCTWRVFKVDPATWAESALVGGIVSASVERRRGGLLESGEIVAQRDVGAGFETGYYRIVLTAEQNGAREREEVATLLCTSSEGSVDHGADTLEVTARSVLYPASTERVLDGAHAPRSVDGAQFAGDMLAGCITAPVSVEGSFTLETDVVFDLGMPKLDAAWEILEAGGFCMQVDGHGTVHVMPLPTTAALDLDSANARLLVPGVKYETDLSDVPNRYTAAEGSVKVTVVNDDPSSPTSTVSRGYVHDVYDDAPKPVNGESLAAYATRRLVEESTVSDERSYSREWWPGVLPYSIVNGNLPESALGGPMRVDRQSLECGAGILVSERAFAEVRTWQG